jgi:hypothetical protein
MSTIERQSLKRADIIVEKLQAEQPQLFQEAPRTKIDLRELQTQLAKNQAAARSASASRTAKLATWKYKYRLRNRAINPVVSDCRIVDTRTDASGKKLFFELSNGQCIRADKALKSSNLVIRGLAAAEIEANANRKEAAQ